MTSPLCSNPVFTTIYYIHDTLWTKWHLRCIRPLCLLLYSTYMILYEQNDISVVFEPCVYYYILHTWYSMNKMISPLCSNPCVYYYIVHTWYSMNKMTSPLCSNPVFTTIYYIHDTLWTKWYLRCVRTLCLLLYITYMILYEQNDISVVFEPCVHYYILHTWYSMNKMISPLCLNPVFATINYIGDTLWKNV